MKPLDFYTYGVQIGETGTTEAEHRTAVNRVYYGLHHEACCRFFRTQPTSQPLNVNRRHTDLRNRYNNPGDPAAGEVGQLLGQLMRLRVEADYQLSPPLLYQRMSHTPRELMGIALEVGADLLDALEAYAPGESPEGCECPQVYSTG